MTTNIDTYLKILAELEANPDASVMQLCKKYKKPYQSFQSWRRRNAPDNHARETTSNIANAKSPLSAAVGLEALAAAEIRGDKTISFPITELVAKLSDEEKKAYEAYKYLIQFAQKMKANKN